MIDSNNDQVLIGTNLSLPYGAIRDRYGWRTHATDAVQLSVDDTAGGETSVASHAAPFNDANVQLADLVAMIGIHAQGFQGIAGTGHQVIFVPWGQPSNADPWSLVCSFDLEASASIGTTNAWKTFDLTSLSTTYPTAAPKARGYLFGCVDGTGKVYFAPQYGDTVTNPGLTTATGVVAQYDPSVGDITDPTAWMLFDLSTINSVLRGYCTCAWDGARYIYFAPDNNGTAGPPLSGPTPIPHGNLVRYDTQSAFTSAGSWSHVNLAALSGFAIGFQTCICANGRLWLVPFVSDGSGGHLMMCSIPVGDDITDLSKWQVLDLTTINPDLLGFTGACAVDGYLYLCPWPGLSFYKSCTVARLDLLDSRGWQSPAAWSVVNIAHMTGTYNDRGYQGCFADESGAFVYFVPDTYPRDSQGNNQTTPRFLAYDTRRDFFDPAGWVAMGNLSNRTPDQIKLSYIFGMSYGGWNWLVPIAKNSGATMFQSVYRWPANPPGRRVQRWQSLWVDSSGMVGISNAQPGGSALDISGAVGIRQVAAPSAPLLTSTGGTHTWGYRIMFLDAGGNPAGSTAEVTVAAAQTLDGINAHNSISWANLNSGKYYATQVYRTTSGGSPSATGLIGTAYGGLSFFDVGQAVGTSFNAPPRNGTGDLHVDGAAVVSGYLSGARVTVSFAASMTIDSTAANLQVIVPTGSAGATINAATAGVPGQHLWIVIDATGSMTQTLTFGTNFRVSSSLPIAAGKGYTIGFFSNGAAWWEHSRSTGLT